MTTKTLAGKILARLKKDVGEADLLSAKVRHLHSRIFADTYAWVEATIAAGGADGTTKAVKLLADTLRKRKNTVFGWYCCGQLMRKHSMKPEQVHPGSVETLRRAQSSLPKADLLKAISAVKEGADGRKIGAMVRRAAAKSDSFSETLAKREVTRLKREGRTSKNDLKFRAIALRLLCGEVFGRDVDIAVVDHATGEVILNIPEA